MKSLTNSIYIIMGKDEERQTEITEQYKNLLPSIECAVIPETKHLPQLEKADEFIEQMNLFLEDEF